MLIKEAYANPGLFLMYYPCCEELEDVFEKGYFTYNEEKKTLGAGYDYAIFKYCPFCGTKIKMEVG